jgi:hypothetical protein
LLGKGLKWELLTWWGIIGGAITLFVAISAVLKLADWARWLVEHWKEWTHAFWVWAFGWLGIHVPPEWTSVLSFLLFASLLAVGQAIQFRRAVKTSLIVDKYHDKSFHLVSWRSALSIVGMLTIAPLISIGGGLILLIWTEADITTITSDVRFIIPGLGLNLLCLLSVIVPFARHKLHAAVATLLLGIFWTIITYQWVETSADIPDMPSVEGYMAMFVGVVAILLFR